MRLTKGIHWSALCALLATVGCPQTKDDDFHWIEAVGGSSSSDASVTAACRDGITAPGCDGGGSIATTLDAGAGGSSNADADAGSDADASASLACENDAVRGPNGDCYFSDATQSTWSAARTSCLGRGEGWDLAASLNATENDFIVQLTGYEAWIGGTDVASEGTWIWVRDGQSFFTVGADAGAAFAPWNGGEPNDQNDSDCLRVLTTGLWADWPCGAAIYGHVCQRTLP
jgi:hypothetical protein